MSVTRYISAITIAFTSTHAACSDDQPRSPDAETTAEDEVESEVTPEAEVTTEVEVEVAPEVEVEVEVEVAPEVEVEVEAEVTPEVEVVEPQGRAVQILLENHSNLPPGELAVGLLLFNEEPAFMMVLATRVADDRTATLILDESLIAARIAADPGLRDFANGYVAVFDNRDGDFALDGLEEFLGGSRSLVFNWLGEGANCVPGEPLDHFGFTCRPGLQIGVITEPDECTRDEFGCSCRVAVARPAGPDEVLAVGAQAWSSYENVPCGALPNVP